MYLSFSPQNQGPREQALTAFVRGRRAAADPDLGWNGTGQLDLQAEQVAGVTVRDPQHAVVTLLVLVNGQLIQLGVPVAASARGVVPSPGARVAVRAAADFAPAPASPSSVRSPKTG